jgi:hypothetical protein
LQWSAMSIAVGATNMKTAEKAPEVKPSEKDAKK